MDILVAIDIGNTNITAGVFKNARLVAKTKIPSYTYSHYEGGLKSLFKKSGLCLSEEHDVIISSVVPVVLGRLVMHLNKIAKCRITILGRDRTVPINNLYKVKSEVGQDRLVNAYAAKMLYGTPAVVIDFGTGYKMSNSDAECMLG